jgi:hypothetical protein
MRKAPLPYTDWDYTLPCTRAEGREGLYVCEPLEVHYLSIERGS